MRVAFYALRSAAVLALGSAFVASAQPIVTFAGGGRPDGTPAISMEYYGAASIAADAAGNVYVADAGANVVWRIDAKTNVITTAAGNGTSGFEGDGGPATSAALSNPVGVVLDKQGNLYIADRFNYRIRKVDVATGVIRTFAGGGSPGDGVGDGGLATDASLYEPWGLSFTSGGDLLIGSNDNRVRKVAAGTGVITTVAGGTTGFGGDGGPATSASLHSPLYAVADAAGNIYIADAGNVRVRKVDGKSGKITTIAGNGSTDLGTENGSALATGFNYPTALVFDASGALLVADYYHLRVRRIDLSSNTISTIAGNGQYGGGDGMPAKDAGLGAPPLGLAFDGAGNLFIGAGSTRRVDAQTTIISTIGGNGKFVGDGRPATSALLNNPHGLVFDAAGNLFIADTNHGLVRRVDASTKSITTVAGDGDNYYPADGDGRNATEVGLGPPLDVALDSGAKGLFIAVSYDGVCRVDLATNKIFRFAGGGNPADGVGDGGPATKAAFGEARGLAFDSAGNLYVSDAARHRIRKIDANGMISTFAGTGAYGFSGDDGPATSAQLDTPSGLAVQGGALYVADEFNHRIRRIDLASRVITTVAGASAGGYGSGGFSGDGGPAKQALLNAPYRLAFDKAGNLYEAEYYNDRVRRVDAATQTISTFAGGGTRFGEGGRANSARLASPRGVAVSSSGDLYISDTGNARVRVVLAGGGCPIPSIDTQPSSPPVVRGFSAILKIQATGTGTVRYQWYRGARGDTSNPIPGATDAQLTTGPLPQTTSFFVRVSDSCGSIDSDTATVVVADALADLSLSMTPSATIVPLNSRVSYTMKARNDGPSPATNVALTVSLPPGMPFAGVTTSQGTCALTASDVACAIGTLVPGAETTVVVTTTAAASGTLFTHAGLTLSETDPNPGDDYRYTTVVVTGAGTTDIAVGVSASPSPVRVGQTLTYTIFVPNYGPETATNVSATSALSSGATFVSATPTQGTCTVTASQVSCSLGTIPAGLAATITAVADPTTVGVVRNTVTARADQPDPIAYDNSSLADVQILSNAPACPPPAPAILGAPSGVVHAGDAFTVSWSDVFGPTDPAGTYHLQLARAADFASASVITDLSTRNLLISFPTSPNVSSTLFFRVAAVGGCGREGAFSATATISVAANPPSLVVTQEQTPDWLVSPGQLPPAATVKFKNVGGAPASVTFRPRGGFFTISPTTANLDPGQETTVTVTPLAGFTNTPGAQQGSLTADYGSGSVSTSINLSVAGSSTSGIAPSLAQDEILIVNKRTSQSGSDFGAPRAPLATLAPLAPGTTIVKVTNPGNQPIFLVPTIGPGGAWLKLDPTDFGKTIPPGASQDIHLSADPSAITPSDYPLPIWTVLTLTPAGGSNADEARVKVFYNEEISVESGAGRGFLASGESSFIVPTSVHKTGAGDTIFTSDGWLRNLSPDPVDFTIYAAPSGQNGQLNAFRVEQTIPPFATLRLFDFIYGLFGNTDLAAHVEIRSAKAGNLSVRTTASGLPGTGDATARYGTEIPVFGAGTGTGVGLPPLILTGIKVTDAFRLNVILAETTGTAARVDLKLYDSSGALVAQNAVDVPAAGNIQNSLFGFLKAPETKVESGSLSIEPVSGSGRVVAIGTLIDNASSSFQALSSRVVSGSSASGRTRLADAAPPRVIPSIVHAPGMNAFFVTELAVTNGTASPAPLHFVYDYSGSAADGSPISGTATADTTLAPRGSLPASKARDCVVNLMGLPAGSNTFGPLRIEGAGIGQVVARATVTTQVDLADPSKGVKGSEFQSYSASSPEAVGLTATPVTIYPGIQKFAGIRTNMILAEVSGQPADVRVRLVNGTTGGVLAEVTRSLGKWERVQVNDIWNGSGGFAIGNAGFDKVAITLEPTGSKAGRVVAALTVIDNVTNSSTILVLSPPGPPPRGAIGF